MHETILMIHGMFGGSWCWDNYRKLFEEKGYHCIIPTLRFHDVSPDELPNPQLGTTSLLDYAADIEREIRKLNSIPFLMGHSMGGLIAQILGSRGLAKGLILLTPASPGGILALTPSVLKSFRSTLTKWGFWKKPVRQKSNVFHRPDCRQAQRISPENITEFGSRNEAVQSGRRPCGVCEP